MLERNLFLCYCFVLLLQGNDLGQGQSTEFFVFRKDCYQTQCLSVCSLLPHYNGDVICRVSGLTTDHSRGLGVICSNDFVLLLLYLFP